MIAGARVEVAPFKRDPMDFVLWKPSDAETPGWNSPWGRVRPGWHIECSAMSHELLGSSFDIHGGGIDLQFPHHENEIAQSRCAHPEDGFAKVWLHNEMLQVEGKKMSKSLGNFFTVRDLLDQGVPGEVIRFVLLGTHYSKPMDWTAEKAEQARRTLEKWSNAVSDRPPVTRASNFPNEPLDANLVAALSDDLNTHEAIQCLHHLFDEARSQSRDANFALARLYHSAKELLGIDLVHFHDTVRPLTLEEAISRLELGAIYNTATFRDQIDHLVLERQHAKRRRDFERADNLRSGLARAGVIVTDYADRSEWVVGANFDPAILETLK
jgi:cysteinyl-tRNA synthetase